MKALGEQGLDVLVEEIKKRGSGSSDSFLDKMDNEIRVLFSLYNSYNDAKYIYLSSWFQFWLSYVAKSIGADGMVSIPTSITVKIDNATTVDEIIQYIHANLSLITFDFYVTTGAAIHVPIPEAITLFNL